MDFRLGSGFARRARGSVPVVAHGDFDPDEHPAGGRRKVKEIWAIRVRLEMQGRLRELALFDLGIDSKLRACDLVSLRVRDVCHGDRVAGRAIVLQQKTQRPVQFEITPPTRDVVAAWIKQAGLKSDSYLFPSRVHASPHLGTRQYAPCATSGSRLTTHWKWRSRQRCSLSKLGGNHRSLDAVDCPPALDGKERYAAAGGMGTIDREPRSLVGPQPGQQRPYREGTDGGRSMALFDPCMGCAESS